MMAKVIITIHGRSNKPKKETLHEWWVKAIDEGLKKNAKRSRGGVPVHMAYYRDLHYPKPVADKDNKEKYKPATRGTLKTYQEGWLDRFKSTTGDWFNKPLDWLDEHTHIFSAAGRKFAKIVLQDLGTYYSDKDRRENTKDRLKELLLEHKHNEIILVAHSMGTIVAYDVMRELGKDSEHPDFIVDHFITMGSPLGMSIVKGNMLNRYEDIRTPSCVRGSWVNYSDNGDIVCIDNHLRDDYAANSYGVRVVDDLIYNDYPGNQHKSYGYLRTPEFSKHLASLL